MDDDEGWGQGDPLAWQDMLTVDGHTNRVHIPHLLPYMSYRFRVKAANVDGYGAASSSVDVPAMCITPVVHLAELRAMETAVFISWHMPEMPQLRDYGAVTIEQFEIHSREVSEAIASKLWGLVPEHRARRPPSAAGICCGSMCRHSSPRCY